MFNYLDQESFDSSASGDEATLREFFASLCAGREDGLEPFAGEYLALARVVA